MNAVLKPSEVLAKAADLIEPEGRWRNVGGWSDGDGPETPTATCWCAMGSIIAVRGAWPDEPSIWSMDETLALAKAVGRHPTALPMWNDAEGRTQAEVVAALRKASALAAEEGQ